MTLLSPFIVLIERRRLRPVLPIALATLTLFVGALWVSTAQAGPWQRQKLGKTGVFLPAATQPNWFGSGGGVVLASGAVMSEGTGKSVKATSTVLVQGRAQIVLKS